MKYKKSYTARGFALLNFCDDNGDLWLYYTDGFPYRFVIEEGDLMLYVP